ncbi:MAG: hypothetical protein VKL39_12960 [Leptolyngbyaceae bacterium]|nr:hypothetical protein [Leptolyngbyaceae bacterium]
MEIFQWPVLETVRGQKFSVPLSERYACFQARIHAEEVVYPSGAAVAQDHHQDPVLLKVERALGQGGRRGAGFLG